MVKYEYNFVKNIPLKELFLLMVENGVLSFVHDQISKSSITRVSTPHHITQRGNRRQDVFFTDSDYEYYFELLVEWCTHEGIEI